MSEKELSKKAMRNTILSVAAVVAVILVIWL